MLLLNFHLIQVLKLKKHKILKINYKTKRRKRERHTPFVLIERFTFNVIDLLRIHFLEIKSKYYYVNYFEKKKKRKKNEHFCILKI